jgi:hypothetical protein
MRIRGLDPRDTAWEVDQPVYRVYFWTGAAGSFSCDEFEVAGGDVDEVLGWAQQQLSVGRTFVLYARITDDRGAGLVRLVGSDPTSAPVQPRPAPKG